MAIDSVLTRRPFRIGSAAGAIATDFTLNQCISRVSDHPVDFLRRGFKERPSSA